ncbi:MULTISPECIES: sulfotransferase domain-containing protein [Olleya]|uniref:sulfotransferase domain-containing protein n=1 Tax=Olleya TaxID=336276 RepID=UPI0012FEAEBE|nr:MULTISPECIES: sulfotransferase domain-containing protein [Olleya]
MKHIIIAGTNKAATTSLFNYLSDHPNVCGSYIKQTNYFLDQEVQDIHKLTSIFPYQDNHLNYQNFFKSNASQKIKLEASPDYMFYNNTSKKIKSFLDNNDGEVVLILRNPVTRFKSWFNFGKQQNLLNEDVDFKQFYELSKSYNGDNNLSLMAHATGFYSNYLTNFKNTLEGCKIHVFFYEDLIADPKQFLDSFCQKTGIDNKFYTNYQFGHYNKTVKIKSKVLSYTYDALRQFYLNYLYKGKVGVYLGGMIKSIVSPLYKKINTSTAKNDTQEEVVSKLTGDYATEKQKIAELFNLTNIPW